MKVNFSARHFDASEKLRLFTIKETERLGRYFEGDLIAEVVLEKNGNRRVADMRLIVLGKVLPARVEGNDFYKIIPKAVDKLVKQLKAQKGKMFNR